ncbi:MAG: hypothetical protein R3B93_12725 [Bacteroidia bacterium]
MPVRSKLPVVFLACVNSYEDGKQLRHLINERKLVAKILNTYQKPSLFYPIQKEKLSNAYFFNHLDEHEHQENVSIVHLVGHADNDHLRIESENFEVPIHVDELSKALSIMPNLRQFSADVLLRQFWKLYSRRTSLRFLLQKAERKTLNRPVLSELSIKPLPKVFLLNRPLKL